MSEIIFKTAKITRPEDNQIEQIKNLFPHISPVRAGDIVAVKIHPGEYGNTTHASMNAPFIVADGLRGGDAKEIRIDGDTLRSITVASAIAEADSMIVISHGKGHPEKCRKDSVRRRWDR